MNASIIICTHNRLQSIERSLLSLRPPSKNKLEAMVVDNASDDNTQDVLATLAKELPFELRMFNEERLRKTHVLLGGIKQLRGRIVLFAGDDVTFLEGCVDHCQGCFQATEGAGMSGAVIPAYHRNRRHWMSPEGPSKITAPFGWDLGDAAIDLTQRRDGKRYGANMGYLRDLPLAERLIDVQLGVFGRRQASGEDVRVSGRLMSAGPQNPLLACGRGLSPHRGVTALRSSVPHAMALFGRPWDGNTLM